MRKMVTKDQLINKPDKLRPHIVILGSGASVAAFPDGDDTGKRLPTFIDFIETLGLEPVLRRAAIKSKSHNFEAIYSELYENDPRSPLLREIEKIVYTYFENLQLPEYPTLYDHLLMALRPKDIVATFNWDPFLFDAWNRNKNEIPLPEIVHLHGNVRISYCLEHHYFGENGTICPECEKEFIPTPLLYPVTKKNYNNDPFIRTQWEVLRKGLSQAMTLTIFGYGAPDTDVEAVELMKNAWDKENKHINRVELIDIESNSILWEKWEPFIIRTYLDHRLNFYESRLSQYPRRTCEALIEQTLHGLWVDNNPIPQDADFDGLYSWLDPLVHAEDSKELEK